MLAYVIGLLIGAIIGTAVAVFIVEALCRLGSLGRKP